MSWQGSWDNLLRPERRPSLQTHSLFFHSFEQQTRVAPRALCGIDKNVPWLVGANGPSNVVARRYQHDVLFFGVFVVGLSCCILEIVWLDVCDAGEGLCLGSGLHSRGWEICYPGAAVVALLARQLVLDIGKRCNVAAPGTLVDRALESVAVSQATQ